MLQVSRHLQCTSCKMILRRGMSGHSKWKTIKHAKSTNDQRRALLFTKLGKEVMSSARLCAGDLSNPRLSTVIAKARANNVPKDNIEGWLKRATGTAAQDQLEEVVYEGLGPGSVQMIICTLTDNRKRTFPKIRHEFTEHGGEVGVSGSVMWNFDRLGYGAVKVQDNHSVDSIQEICIDNGAEDVDFDESSNNVEWYCSINDLITIRNAVESHELKVEMADIIYKPKSTTTVPVENEESFQNLLEALDDDPDVQNIFHNAS